MQILKIGVVAAMLGVVVMGCAKSPLDLVSSPDVKVEALVATPTIVGAGQNATLVCHAKSAKGLKLSYAWAAEGAYGGLISESPYDSVCTFMSPSCHSGPAKVTVTVTDESGASTQGAVELNK